jgi:hypothetical protein
MPVLQITRSVTGLLRQRWIRSRATDCVDHFIRQARGPDVCRNLFENSGETARNVNVWGPLAHGAMAWDAISHEQRTCDVLVFDRAPTFPEQLEYAHSHHACRVEWILLPGKVDIDHFFDTPEVVFFFTIGGGREK